MLNKEETNTEKLIEIAYYTDPLCCWSWAFEPQWRRLRYEYGQHLQWHYLMAGMLPSWTHFSDPIYSVNRPLQMGPVWLEAQQLTGQTMHNRIWGEDPPQSSYPACIAVKCAALQSPRAEEAYLRRLREAVMLEGKNIAKEEVLFALAHELESHKPGLLEAAQLQHDYQHEKGQQAFREDLQKVRFGNISRFPTLIIKRKDRQALMITGYRPYEVLLAAVLQLAPELKPAQQAKSAEAYTRYWGSTTEKEVAVALQQEVP